MAKGTILYIGGFQLPDKNAAALRVISNAKALRDIGYKVVFVNALSDYEGQPRKIYYEGFLTYEYRRESQEKYLFSCRQIIALIERTNVLIVIAYNYPAVALNNLKSYCKENGIKCYADATEWYKPTGNIIFRLMKGFDTELRMRYIQTRMDGVIAISEYLYQYYKDKVNAVKIPPLVDMDENKWQAEDYCDHKGIKLIYAGSPSAQKEKLDVVVDAVESSNREDICLDVVGLTKEQYNEMYDLQYQGNRVRFHGRVSNAQVIQMTKKADWVVVLRERNKVVEAGFPTKIPEAIACGTPVIANRFSNIEEYLDESNSILLDLFSELKGCLEGLQDKTNRNIDKRRFDYRKYINEFQCLFGEDRR